MGNLLEKICPCCPKRRNDNHSLTQSLLDEYKSTNMSCDMEELKTLKEMKIKPSTFIREQTCLPNELYEKICDIGEGSYGSVLKVKPFYLNEERAMKIIKRENLFYNVNESDIHTEIKILKNLDHPNIIKIHEFFSDSVNYYIITEYCEEGDLYSKIEKISYFTERVVKNIMKQVLSAVAYLHSKGIIHGDLKLENIMIDSKGYAVLNESLKKSSFDKKKELFDEYFDIKLIDFGCSKIFVKGKKYSSIQGTVYYLAPEVIRNECDEKSDLWSCGVLMYILLLGRPPFMGNEELELYRNIEKGDIDFKHSGSSLSLKAIELLKLMLTFDPKKRVSARQALKNQWFINNEEEMSSYIDINYSNSVLNNLRNFNAEQKFQQAVVTYITHNLVRKTESQNLKRLFVMLDKDNDGRISKLELKQAFSDIQGTILADIELENIFKSIDHDNNGYIEYEEFLRATLDKHLLLSESNLQMAFNLFDIDKNGFISIDEIKNIIGGGKCVPDHIMVELLAEIDKKAHEEVSFIEFKAIMKKIVR